MATNNKTRLSVTMPKPYIEALDILVDKGLYLSRGEAILQAVRDLFGEHQIELFYKKTQNPVE